MAEKIHLSSFFFSKCPTEPFFFLATEKRCCIIITHVLLSVKLNHVAQEQERFPTLKHTLVLLSFLHHVQIRGFLALNVRFYWRQPDLWRLYAGCKGGKKKKMAFIPPMGSRYCYNDVAPRALASHKNTAALVVKYISCQLTGKGQ